jgi:hypothetical protein
MLLALTPGITEAYCYSSCYGGVRYSPYALSYEHSGLVPSGVDYSPYALTYGRSGLVYECTQYTPYALSYYSSGLVPGYGICSYGDCGYPVFDARVRRVSHAAPRAPRAPQPIRRCAQDTPRPIRPPDGMDVIRRHLQAKGFTSVSIDRILRVDNQLVSVDILVKNRNLLIKYWNPQEVERLSTKEAFKQKAYAKYKQDWEQFAEQYKQAGGEVYTVSASEPETIVAALESCTKLAPGKGVQTPALYAKN